MPARRGPRVAVCALRARSAVPSAPERVGRAIPSSRRSAPAAPGPEIEICPRCRGARKVVKPAAEEPCSGCEAKGKFACPLCAGSGRLPSIIVGGKDVRKLTPDQLSGALAAVSSALVAIEGGSRFDKAANRPMHPIELIVNEVAKLAPLALNQVERLSAVVATDDPKPGEAELGMIPFTVSRYLSSLSHYLEQQQQLIERALWLHRRNIPGPATAASRRKAGELQWDGWFGQAPADPSTTYSILGRGMIRTPSAGIQTRSSAAG